MKKLMTMTRQFRDDENGAAMVEYTVLLGIITVAVIASVIVVGTWVSGRWTGLTAALATVPALPAAPAPAPGP
ncbi:Flp family type IVb pilin [Mesorhizobium sp. WSM1293]|uniref:Flp family type IVb pilin n=1 Tax=Mesorhizobium sp. WSM1293 TaxID=1040984 RepID=UPI0004B1F275|nr:Flp family type IVb pilin [Mesorhizobium sp. WSM1293]